jgi:ATP-dependent RNA helicase DDX10/DBP4
LRSVHFQKNKDVFKLGELPIEAFAASLGLPGAPKIKFLSKEMAKQKKNAPKILLTNENKTTAQRQGASEDEESGSGEDEEPHSSSDEDETRPEAAAPDTQAAKVCACVCFRGFDSRILYLPVEYSSD